MAGGRGAGATAEGCGAQGTAGTTSCVGPRAGGTSRWGSPAVAACSVAWPAGQATG